MADAMRVLSARYRSAVRDRPRATSDEVVERIVGSLTRDEVVALAAQGLGMGGWPGLDSEVLARGFVHNFVYAMDSPDDE